jgi:hypothetical protein
MKATVSLRAQNILDDRLKGRLLVNAIRDEINNRNKIIKPGDALYNDDINSDSDNGPDSGYVMIKSNESTTALKRISKAQKQRQK